MAPQNTTLASTVVRGQAGAGGYVRLAAGPGEPHVLRQDLGTRAHSDRATRRRSLLAFAQLTDIHLVDAQSPARVEFLDRYNDGAGSALPFSAAYRPHEMLTSQVADRLVAAVEQVARGPVAGGPLAFVICTGDNTDNCQRNELRWQIDLLDGLPIRPDSGDTGRWEGVHDQDATSYDIHYWHPDGTPTGKADDALRAVHGFPVVKGLLDAARRPFTAHGLKRPWYTCYGNHDGLVQGNFPQSFKLSALATGPLKVTSLPAGVSLADVAAADLTVVPKLVTAPVRVVTADAERRVLTRTETVKEHFSTGGRPLGHGYTAANLAAGTAYFVFDPIPLVRGIVLDTVNPNGESDGSIDQTQLAWLTAQLQAARGKLVLVFSHHTIASMTNQLVSVDSPSPRVLGATVRDLLLSYPNVVAWVNGHTHVNRVTPYRRASGGGFWEVNTASHVDWPAQARLLELVDNGDGTLSLFGTVLDAAAPLAYGGRLGSSTALASLARELAANDPQERSDTRRGKVEDRNVELIVQAPFALGRP
ncbi:MAG: family metallophosphoesterase [Frankiales bacterium]|nr:family metallophosphoesterase [Frankiales bacterium]